MIQSEDKMECANALIKILESKGVKFIFGHPGEQILPFYHALRDSNIKHILMRHEQGAAHAADGYARASGSFGVCLASAGPGALNLVMGVATAYKDSVPLIVITGDVPTNLKGKNVFQEIDISDVFKPITIKTFNNQEAEEGIFNLKKAFKMIKYGKKGPIHLNFPKNVLNAMVDGSLPYDDIEYTPKIDSSGISDVVKLIEESRRPFILAGAGVIWSNAADDLKHFVEVHDLPLATTYHARGVLPEDHPLSLGMIGLRGTEAANFAGKSCDVLLALGCRFSERTLTGIGEPKIIHVNLDRGVLMGDVKIQMDVGEFLKEIRDIGHLETRKWLDEIKDHHQFHKIKTNYEEIPIKPQQAIKEILDASGDFTTVNDAGAHTTWVTLLKKVKRPSSLIFSGGFAPMGYALPAAVGASLANPGESIVVITGDGGFQMTSQELATIVQYKLPIVICVVNNSSLGIIKQWQELYYEGPFEVELENPNFLKLAEAYHVFAERVDSPGTVFKSVKKALELKEPFLIEVVVDKDEGIPLPNWKG